MINLRLPTDQRMTDENAVSDLDAQPYRPWQAIELMDAELGL